MTPSETQRLHSQLSRLEDAFPGYKIEIVGGSIVVSPVRPVHGRTIRLVENALEEQLSSRWEAVSDVAFPFSDGYELCPDTAVIPAEEAARNLSSYPPDLIEIAVEVVSPSSVRNDYEIKQECYAKAGIPVYLIFDPYRAHCVTMWHPDGDGYLGRDTIAYGKTVTLPTPLGQLLVDTGRLPRDPGETQDR